MMRQTGRYLPEFIALRDQYDFFTRCQTPELAAEITVQLIRRFPLDAAILFSDILVVPQAMGIDFKMKESVGPWLDKPIRTLEQVQNLQVEGAEENLKYVYDAIDITLQKLENEIPLIGFAGSPWTFFVIVLKEKVLNLLTLPSHFALLNQKQHICFYKKITDVTIAYLKRKVQSGVSAVQFLILGAECFLQKIIKSFLGNTLTKL